MEGCFMFQGGGGVGGAPWGGIGFNVGPISKKNRKMGGAPLMPPSTMGNPDSHISICVRPPNTRVALKQFNLAPPNTLFTLIYYPLTHQFEAITLR